MSTGNRIDLTENAFMIESDDGWRIFSGGQPAGEAFPADDGTWKATRYRFPLPGETPTTVTGYGAPREAALALLFKLNH